MKRLKRICIASTIAVLAAAACGKSATERKECTTGTERCGCYRNGTCDEGLECRSDLCVEPGTGGTSGSGGEPAGGNGNTSGTGSGGRGGRGGTSTGGAGDGGEDTGDTGGASGDAGEPGGGTGGVGGSGGTMAGAGGMPMGGAGAGGTPAGGAGAGGTRAGGAGSGGAPGGAAGSGGGGCPVRIAAPSDTLIDDLEDQDNTIAPPRVGYWFTFTDLSCRSAIPPPDPTGAMPFPPAPGSGQNGSVGARFRGTGCTTWGAGLGFDLANCVSRAEPYDATVFGGISFWYKSITALRLMVVTTAVIPTMRGGTCVPGTALGTECDNPHGADLPPSATGSVVSLRFSALSQTFGQPQEFDESQLLFVEFMVAQEQTFDFTIDNVAFVP